MAPSFGFDDGSNSDFDATLVLATMLVSQLSEVNDAKHPPAASVPHAQDVRGHSQKELDLASQQQFPSTRLTTPRFGLTSQEVPQEALLETYAGWLKQKEILHLASKMTGKCHIR